MMEEWADRRRRIHSVAVLAHASADVTNPLLLSNTLKVSVKLCGAVHGLHCMTWMIMKKGLSASAIQLGRLQLLRQFPV